MDSNHPTRNEKVNRKLKLLDALRQLSFVIDPRWEDLDAEQQRAIRAAIAAIEKHPLLKPAKHTS